MKDIQAWLPDHVWERLLLAIPFLAMLLVAGLNFRIIGDENAYLNVINGFATQWPRPDIYDYTAASPPLPFLLLTIYGKVVGFELWKLRLLAVVATYTTANLFLDLAKRQQLPYPLLSTFIFLFFPYTFFHGFTLYMNSFAALFGVWALHYYLAEEPGTRQLLAGGFLATLAFYARQSYIVLPAGMLIYEVLRIPVRQQLKTLPQKYPRWLALALPFVLLLPLILFWGGFTTPGHQSTKPLYFSGQRANFSLVFVGFYFLPMLINPKTTVLLRARRVALAVVIPLVLFFVLFPPTFDLLEQRDAVTGLIMQGLDVIGAQIAPSMRYAAMFVLWMVGLLIILGEITDKPWSTVKSRVLAMLAVFLLMITVTPQTTERYFMLTMPLLILMTHQDYHRRRPLLLWLVYLTALTVAFSYWQIELKLFDIYWQPPSS